MKKGKERSCPLYMLTVVTVVLITVIPVIHQRTHYGKVEREEPYKPSVIVRTSEHMGRVKRLPPAALFPRWTLTTVTLGMGIQEREKGVKKGENPLETWAVV